MEGCEFVGTESTALAVSSFASATCRVARNLFAHNNATGTPNAGAVYWRTVGGTFEENTVVGNGMHGLWIERLSAMANWRDVGRGMDLTAGSPSGPASAATVTVRRNIFASTVGGAAIRLGPLPSAPPVSECNDFWNNPAGNTDGFVPGPTDRFLDPLFCGEAGGDYALSGASPCLPVNSGGCGQIGAFGQGCEGIAIERTSWGALKAAYRGESRP